MIYRKFAFLMRLINRSQVKTIFKDDAGQVIKEINSGVTLLEVKGNRMITDLTQVPSADTEIISQDASCSCQIPDEG